MKNYPARMRANGPLSVGQKSMGDESIIFGVSRLQINKITVLLAYRFLKEGLAGKKCSIYLRTICRFTGVMRLLALLKSCAKNLASSYRALLPFQRDIIFIQILHKNCWRIFGKKFLKLRINFKSFFAIFSLSPFFQQTINANVFIMCKVRRWRRMPQ